MVFVIFSGVALVVGLFLAGVFSADRAGADRNQTPGVRAGPNMGYGPDFTGPLPALRLEGDAHGTYQGEKAEPLPKETAEDAGEPIPPADSKTSGLRQRKEA